MPATKYDNVPGDVRSAKQAGEPIIVGNDSHGFWPSIRCAVEESFSTDFKISGAFCSSIKSTLF